MQRNEGGETPAEVLRARIRRRCEAEGSRLKSRRDALPMIGVDAFQSPMSCGIGAPCVLGRPNRELLSWRCWTQGRGVPAWDAYPG